MTQPTPDPLLGRTLDGRYRIEARLGEGGLGVVYRAIHERLGRPFAVKVLQPEYAQDAALRARFEREARALGALSHPHVVAVTDFGVDGDVPYLVMELLEGRSLEEAIAAGLPPAEAVAIGRDVVAAVAYAHGLGLVHRDLKPANVFLQRVPDAGEVVRVLDFGLAKFLDAGTEAALTRAGTAMGTPAYMSPEQAMGGGASARNDVYSLGILLYELFTGERPFRGHGGELMRQHLLEPLPSLGARRPDVPAFGLLDPVVQRAAAKTPAERFPDAGELRVALERSLDGSIEIPTMRALAEPLSNASETARDGGAPPWTPRASEEKTSLAPSGQSARSSATSSAPAPGSYASASATATASSALESTVHHAPDEPSPASRRFPVIALLPLAILAPGAILAAYTFFAPGDAGETEAAGAAPDTGEPGAPSEHAPSAATESPDTGVDPWSLDEPAALAPLRARVLRGQTLDDGDRSTIRRVAHADPTDPRPWLLYGHADFVAGARTDAMTRYERAMEVSPSARHDPLMLENLVTMSFHRTVGERARELVRTVYGRQALAAVEAARAARTDPGEIAALDALAARLRTEGS